MKYIFTPDPHVRFPGLSSSRLIPKITPLYWKLPFLFNSRRYQGSDIYSQLSIQSVNS